MVEVVRNSEIIYGNIFECFKTMQNNEKMTERANAPFSSGFFILLKSYIELLRKYFEND